MSERAEKNHFTSMLSKHQTDATKSRDANVILPIMALHCIDTLPSPMVKFFIKNNAFLDEI